MRWYRRAADQGYANAQFSLGVMYAEGRGVSKNDEEAVKWFRRAAAQGHVKAKEGLKALLCNAELDEQTVTKYFPSNTRRVVWHYNDTVVWMIQRNTKTGMVLEIGLYYDYETGGYIAQLFSPSLEEHYLHRELHINHSAVIDLGILWCPTLMECFTRACLWAENAAAMVQSHELKISREFPSLNSP